MNSILPQEAQFSTHAFAQKAGSIDTVERERERERERENSTYIINPYISPFHPNQAEAF